MIKYAPKKRVSISRIVPLILWHEMLGKNKRLGNLKI
jgi:hypothetical protein